MEVRRGRRGRKEGRKADEARRPSTGRRMHAPDGRHESRRVLDVRVGALRQPPQRRLGGRGEGACPAGGRWGDGWKGVGGDGWGFGGLETRLGACVRPDALSVTSARKRAPTSTKVGGDCGSGRSIEGTHVNHTHRPTRRRQSRQGRHPRPPPPLPAAAGAPCLRWRCPWGWGGWVWVGGGC